jgi:hypothetical protein
VELPVLCYQIFNKALPELNLKIKEGILFAELLLDGHLDSVMFVQSSFKFEHEALFKFGLIFELTIADYFFCFFSHLKVGWQSDLRLNLVPLDHITFRSFHLHVFHSLVKTGLEGEEVLFEELVLYFLQGG